MAGTGKRDLFPFNLALCLTALVVGTAVLIIADHPVLAILTAVAAALVALTLGGWLVAGPYLEADIIVIVRANGGQMPMARLASREPDDRLIAHLTRTGVISVADGNVVLHEAQIGRLLAFFIRLRLAK